MVTVAVDKLGNVGVSAPLRICIDSDGDGENANGDPLTDQGCADDYGEIGTVLPSCTDGCTLPLSFEDVPEKQIRVLQTKPPAP